ncbi:MAG: CehA/McbA family metallohydrolase, partial [Pirellulales bacterium]
MFWPGDYIRIARACAALGLLMAVAAQPVVAQSEVATLQVEIHDRQSGQIVPAMICITSLADNTWRVPPDGRMPAGYITNRDIIEGRSMGMEYVAGKQKKWSPGDPGPAVLMNGDFGDDITVPPDKRKRNPWYEGKPAVPFWKDPAAYFVSGPFSITLPPGKWRLSVMRGIEYLPVFEEFAVAAGEHLERKVPLARWVDMPGQGWYSGDPHVHSPRLVPMHDVYVMTWAKATDVHMTTVNIYADKRGVYCDQQAFGKDSHYRQGDYILASGAEDPRAGIDDQGHVTQLNIQKFVRDTSKYRAYDYVFDGVHAQGGLVGYNHLSWSGDFFRGRNPDLNPGWDASINVIRGKIDFIEIMEAAHLGLEDYYDFLNLGVKLTAMACSDSPAAVVGEQRVYAYTGPGRFSADSWYQAVKQGHTFITNGPMLQLTVNGQMPGDEVRVSKDARVRIHARAWAPELIGLPKVLEIISQGRVIHSVERHAPTQEKLETDFELPAEESRWIAARTTCVNGAVAHTTPVYLIVDGAGFFDRTQLPQLVDKRLKVLDWLERRLQNPRVVKSWTLEEASQVMAGIKDARAKYLA